IGEAHEVTESSGHLVQRIGGEPALQLYGRYYGEVPTGFLGEYPLAVYESGPDGPWALRAILGVDADTGEMRFAGDVPVGAHVRMTEVVPEGILSGTMESIRNALDRFPQDTTPELALLFTCAARKWVLGSQAADEIRTVRENLRDTAPENMSLAGLYVYGEIAPDQPGTKSLLYNETCVTVLLGSNGRQNSNG
ncbi:MAG: hypothetical protein GY953_16355, partial [bacterium]|nr:hypothetical protein [bacterium]